MIDEEHGTVFANFIQNSHLSTTLFKKGETDEFYVKDDNFCFYYYKLSNLAFMILYDKETTIDDMINVKVNLKTYIEQFEDKDYDKINSKRK
jgi:hypothetical protein